LFGIVRIFCLRRAEFSEYSDYSPGQNFPYFTYITIYGKILHFFHELETQPEFDISGKSWKNWKYLGELEKAGKNCIQYTYRKAVDFDPNSWYN